ncbi:hypothetical protein MBT84_49180 [Streptomyces sp. MBT84]|nr:hypothetical protein [Streptomyces sp. MBT84]
MLLASVMSTAGWKACPPPGYMLVTWSSGPYAPSGPRISVCRRVSRTLRPRLSTKMNEERSCIGYSTTTLDARDRVAGLLSLLYAQPFSVIIRLTADHVVVREKTVFLRLGKEPLELFAELGNLVQQIAADRRRAGQIGQIEAPWLFPGIRPGQHLSHITLAARLKRLGIRSLPSRTAAIRDLTADVPAAVVNRLLGVSTSTATSWAKGSSKASYAAEVARRSSSV